LYVHEMIGANFGRKKKGKTKGNRQSGPKWFEKAMDRNGKKIIRIVADNAKI
jgi:hypothetical protein